MSVCVCVRERDTERERERERKRERKRESSRDVTRRISDKSRWYRIIYLVQHEQWVTWIHCISLT